MHLVAEELSTWFLVIGTLGSISLLASTWNTEVLNEMLIMYKRGKERGLAGLLREKKLCFQAVHTKF